MIMGEDFHLHTKPLFLLPFRLLVFPISAQEDNVPSFILATIAKAIAVQQSP